MARLYELRVRPSGHGRRIFANRECWRVSPSGLVYRLFHVRPLIMSDASTPARNSNRVSRPHNLNEVRGLVRTSDPLAPVLDQDAQEMREIASGMQPGAAAERWGVVQIEQVDTQHGNSGYFDAECGINLEPVPKG